MIFDFLVGWHFRRTAREHEKRLYAGLRRPMKKSQPKGRALVYNQRFRTGKMETCVSTFVVAVG
jgi:hypothetical protein